MTVGCSIRKGKRRPQHRSASAWRWRGKQTAPPALGREAPKGIRSPLPARARLGRRRARPPEPKGERNRAGPGLGASTMMGRRAADGRVRGATQRGTPWDCRAAARRGGWPWEGHPRPTGRGFPCRATPTTGRDTRGDFHISPLGVCSGPRDRTTCREARGRGPPEGAPARPHHCRAPSGGCTAPGAGGAGTNTARATGYGDSNLTRRRMILIRRPMGTTVTGRGGRGANWPSSRGKAAWGRQIWEAVPAGGRFRPSNQPGTTSQGPSRNP
mmetsp:Transcript_62382/g.197619  ORF Transcript_62382/g.197619 Transcript_62382/m.197619 type:complete len:271 (+) Transcript_62382:448-1260(+)